MRFLTLLAIGISTAYSADFTTYIGGTSQTQSIAVSAIATDSVGNTYVTGSNAFVTKLDPNGNIVFTTSIGPVGSFGNAIAADPTGNIWVGGQTTATNFPLVSALQSSGGPGGTGFLVKIAPDGTVAYSSYLGGILGNSGVNGVATDQSGNVYVTGFTDASDFPTTPGLPAGPVTGSYPPVYGVFAAKLDSAGQKILYSTVIAGMNCDSCGTPNVPRTVGIGIAVDGSGNAVVAGDTNSTDLPVNSEGNSIPAAFVFKINPSGSEIVYFTYLESGVSVGNFFFPDTGAASPIAADTSGNAYLAGSMNDSSGKPQTFVAELSPEGAGVWSVLLGSSAGSWANAISLDSSDAVWITGTNGTMSPGGSFVEQLVSPGPAPPYSAQFPAGAAGQAIAIDPSGAVHFAGALGLVSTLTPSQPLAPRVLSVVNAASGQLSGTIAPGEVISIYGLELSPITVPATAAPVNGAFPNTLGGVQVLVNGSPVPLLYVSYSQINAEIPSPIPDAASGIADLRVVQTVVMWDPVQQITYMVTLPDFRLAVASSDFAVFEKTGGSMAVLNQDGTVNKIANPAKPGSVVSIWATGFGSAAGPVNGSVATAANNYCDTCRVVLNYESTNIPETVQYAGSSPGLIDGLTQINFTIPTELNSDGAWVYFTPPGQTQQIQLGWVNISQ